MPDALWNFVALRQLTCRLTPGDGGVPHRVAPFPRIARAVARHRHRVPAHQPPAARAPVHTPGKNPPAPCNQAPSARGRGSARVCPPTRRRRPSALTSRWCCTSSACCTTSPVTTIPPWNSSCRRTEMQPRCSRDIAQMHGRDARQRPRYRRGSCSSGGDGNAITRHDNRLRRNAASTTTRVASRPSST